MTRRYIDRLFERQTWIPNPDTLYAALDSYITFGFFNHDVTRGAAVVVPHAGDAISHGQVENMISMNLVTFSNEKFEPGPNDMLELQGRAAVISDVLDQVSSGDLRNLDWNPRTCEYIITFWNTLREVRLTIDPAIALCVKASGDGYNTPYDGNKTKWYITTSDWSGAYNELSGKPQQVNKQQQRDVELQRQMHLARPEVKRAMGVRPQYLKKGPSLTDRQRASTSESLDENKIDYWMVPDDKDNVGRMHQLARKHGAMLLGGDHQYGFNFKFKDEKARRSFAAAVRDIAKRAGNVDV